MRQFNNILLIDDDAVTNFLNENIIESMNIANRIIIASSGKEGLTKVREIGIENLHDYPDIILLDINMPGMDGFEFVKELKILNGKSDKIHVFMLTSSLNHKDMQSANCNRICGYFSKPLVKKYLNIALKRIAEVDK